MPKKVKSEARRKKDRSALAKKDLNVLVDTYVEADAYVDTVVGLSFEEKNHVRSLLEGGKVVPEAIIRKSAISIKGVLARNPLSTSGTMIHNHFTI